MNVRNVSNICFMCGETGAMTSHHAIPKWMNPKMNVEIPVCRKCHDRIHEVDVASMIAFAYKLHKSGKEVEKQAAILVNMIKTHKGANKNAITGQVVKQQ